MKTKIHVNQHKIRANLKNKTNEPVIAIKTYKSTLYAHSIIIHGLSKLLYQPNKPLSCGARVWLETDALVEIIKEQEE